MVTITQKQSGAKKASASAKAAAKKVAPNAKANIGSIPATRLRGASDVFGSLIEDHDKHRALIAMICSTEGNTPDRRKLFKELTYEIKGHSLAEEQALWSTVLRKPEITEDGRHAVAEHKELDDMLNDLAARDVSKGGWLKRFNKIKEEYLHHIKEEEQELFVSVEKVLTSADKRYMREVFTRRKKAEKDQARVTPKIKKK